MATAMDGLEALLEMSRKMQERLDELKAGQRKAVDTLQRSVVNSSDFSLALLVGEGGARC